MHNKASISELRWKVVKWAREVRHELLPFSAGAGVLLRIGLEFGWNLFGNWFIASITG
jgi:hypothetical protein